MNRQQFPFNVELCLILVLLWNWLANEIVCTSNKDVYELNWNLMRLIEETIKSVNQIVHDHC